MKINLLQFHREAESHHLTTRGKEHVRWKSYLISSTMLQNHTLMKKPTVMIQTLPRNHSNYVTRGDEDVYDAITTQERVLRTLLV